jgi:excisionase family DNA binding protein
MAEFSQRAPLFGTDDGSATPQRQAVSEAACVDKPCRGDDLPAWVKLRPPAKAPPSARTAFNFNSPSLNVDQVGERFIPNRPLTVAETASFFQVSEKTIRRMIARGELPSARIGRCIRISPEAIERIVPQGE